MARSRDVLERTILDALIVGVAQHTLRYNVRVFKWPGGWWWTKSERWRRRLRESPEYFTPKAPQMVREERSRFGFTGSSQVNPHA